MRSDVLDVIVPYSNPMRWDSRQRLFLACIKRLAATPFVRLTVVLQTHGNQEHNLDIPPGVHVLRVHGRTLLWSKENLINLGIQRLAPDWKYVCWYDGDVIQRDDSWAAETIHILGHYPVVQPWQTCIDLGPRGEVLKVDNSFCYQWVHDPHTCHRMGTMGYKLAHPGYAWAMTRWAFETVGGLLETAILGAADHHMALALIGKADYSIKKGISDNYARPIRQFERFAKKLGKMLYYVPTTIEHPWHGNKVGKLGRKYVERWQILISEAYDPETDIKYNAQGVIELAGNKPGLAHKIYRYHADRNEDINALVE